MARVPGAAGPGNYVVVSTPTTAATSVYPRLLDGWVTVTKEASVSAGQVIGQVGQTGDATAPRPPIRDLAPDGWYWSDAKPGTVDPMPPLQAWAAAG